MGTPIKFLFFWVPYFECFKKIIAKNANVVYMKKAIQCSHMGPHGDPFHDLGPQTVRAKTKSCFEDLRTTGIIMVKKGPFKKNED